MSAITYRTEPSATFHAASETFTRIATYVGHFVDGAREGQEIAARYDELSKLSSATRASRGLDRGSIARAALTGH